MTFYIPRGNADLRRRQLMLLFLVDFTLSPSRIIIFHFYMLVPRQSIMPPRGLAMSILGARYPRAEGSLLPRLDSSSSLRLLSAAAHLRDDAKKETKKSRKRDDFSFGASAAPSSIFSTGYCYAVTFYILLVVLIYFYYAYFFNLSVTNLYLCL